MGKLEFQQQLSFDEAQDAVENYEDIHYQEFQNLLFNELLINICEIPFDNIIQNYLLTPDNCVYKTKEAHSLVWLYRADRKILKPTSTTVYSFRFANVCHPEFYETFEIKAHHLFIPIPGIRHRYYGWYKYVGKDLLDPIDKCLNIRRVVDSHHPHVTKLFINKKEYRLDIQFNFYTLNERIAITFEPGYPEEYRID
jgi:hypothetical protein